MILFPMAGLSQRFAKAGYTLPKYMLDIGGRSVFAHVVGGFDTYFKTQPFVFICRDVADTPAFVAAECAKLGIVDPRIIVLNQTTRGQAETVALGLQKTTFDLREPLTIFNIDTLRPNFRFPDADVMIESDGYLEVFRGEGDGWSFARTVSAEDFTVVETAEKKRISDLCSTGLYHFAYAQDFLDAFELETQKPPDQWAKQELYIAPLYNTLIAKGRRIVAVEIPAGALIPCGVPDEYEALKKVALQRP